MWRTSLILAALVVALAASGSPAEASPASPQPQAAARGEGCAAPCGMYFLRKGDGGGKIKVTDPSGNPKECVPDCFLVLDFPSDTGTASIRPVPDPGSVFRGWEFCTETAGNDCLVDVGDFINADTLCVTFVLIGSPSPGPGCPPATPQPPPPVVDTTAPNTRIRSGPAGTTTSRRAVFRFRSTERPSVFICKLDRRVWGPCRSPKRYWGLKPGTHAFRVRAIDVAGNLDRTPAVRRWRIRALAG